MFASYVKVIEKCERLAREKGQRMAVTEIDSEEDRVIRIYPESYTYSDEFEAFCGEVLYVSENGAEANGCTETTTDGSA